MPRLKALRAREVLDSRGVPTVEAEALLDSGHRGRAIVPSGASTGEHEAIELRDGDPKRFFGKGVLAAVRNVAEVLGPELAGREVSDQSAIDEAMIRLDGTPNKGRLGANALLGASMAISRAAARAADVPLYEHLRRTYGVSDREYVLPAPMLNVLNGGRHADSGLDIQEFMIVPIGAASFAEAIRFGAQAYQTLKRLLQKRKLSTAVGDEGGFAPRLKSNEEALALLDETLRSS
ncbi:MAG: phosphopyruvate hydratase, partial [Elusimicrobia bacterium]|nr:phosphopyruvate hydratase [Elusimicrobiota bacterium]